MIDLSQIYSKKQLEIYKKTLQDDFFILINHGAKRSGKTILNNDLFLQELIRIRKQADIEKVEQPIYILSGVTLTTIYQNILNELINRYGLKIKFDRFNNFWLFGVYVVQVGHGTIAGLGKVRGLTAYGAYVNEASLANKEVFDEIKSRCSGFGARILVDTNPDNPEHWLKKDYIENKDNSILKFKFTLFDNPFLNERYKKNIIATTPSGMFTERNIYGNWVSGEGVIYKDFNPSKHFINSLEGFTIKKYIAGVDWGYSHYGAIAVIGETVDGKYVLVKEVAKTFEEIDFWVKQALQVKKEYGNITFYCDSARTEHCDRFLREGLNAVLADKNVMAGVEEVASLMKQDKILIYEPTAVRFKEEIYSYIWDKNGKVTKENDDVMDSIRYAIYTDKVEKSTVVNMYKNLL